MNRHNYHVLMILVLSWLSTALGSLLSVSKISLCENGLVCILTIMMT